MSHIQNVINWNPNDGVSTKQIINWSIQDMPDYMVVADENGDIDSRWFVIEATRTRAMQLELTLYRDIIVDNYDAIIQAPCFIEKATPLSIRDPAIYNSENMTYNQIKYQEQLLWDETKCPWIVGYIPRDSFKQDTEVSIDISKSGAQDITIDSINNYEFYKYRDESVMSATEPEIYIRTLLRLYRDSNTYNYGNRIKLNVDGNYIGTVTDTGLPSYPTYTWYYTIPTSESPGNRFTDEYARQVVKNMPSIANYFEEIPGQTVDTNLSTEEYNRLVADTNKIIYESSTGWYWTMTIEDVDGTGEVFPTQYDIPWASSMGMQMRNTIVTSFGPNNEYSFDVPSPSGNETPFYYVLRSRQKKVVFKRVYTAANVTIPATRYHASQTPYDIFCIPYSDNLTIYKDNEVYISNTNSSTAITLAQQIATQIGSDNIYDVQLLPYCPVRYCIKEDGTFDIGDTIYSDITSAGSTVNVLLWLTSDNFQFQIPVSIPEEQSVLNKKVANETKFIRLVSSNFSSSFQMNPQMNNGIFNINVLCHYKPYNPYIKLQPDFDGLYGDNYNDARGLICNGDFSLAQITSAWANYELQNKNYQNMFDRQIQNMEVNQNIQRLQDQISMYTGVLGAGSAGAGLGMMLGGGVGVGVGAVAGSAASFLGGIADYNINEKLRNEALDYTKDQFGYQLGNIKALPYGLAKTSAISPDNKYVPFIEYYHATEQEEQALIDKLTYNGYTIGRIGTISNYMQSTASYIKGKLIRLEDIADDFHMLKAISDEIYKGVFI